MADGRHFENGFITISQPQIIWFQWNLVCHYRFLVLRTVTWQSIKILQIQNGGRRTWKILNIENRFFGYISTIYCQIKAKFDMKKQNYVQI